MTEAEMRHEGRGFRWSWQKDMTDEEIVAEEAAWEKKYRQQQRDEQAAFDARGGQPPRQSRVHGPPADWKRWCALLDGMPVGSCTAYDADAGWVAVWPLVRTANPVSGMRARSATACQRRLYGRVEGILCAEYEQLAKEKGKLEVYEDEDRGERIPGTDVRTLSELRVARNSGR